MHHAVYLPLYTTHRSIHHQIISFTNAHHQTSRVGCADLLSRCSKCCSVLGSSQAFIGEQLSQRVDLHSEPNYRAFPRTAHHNPHGGTLCKTVVFVLRQQPACWHPEVGPAFSPLLQAADQAWRRRHTAAPTVEECAD